MLCLRTACDGSIGYFDGIIRGSNFNEYLEVVKNLPSRKWDKSEKVWHIGIHDYELLRNDLAEHKLFEVDVSSDLKSLLSHYKQWESDIVELINKEDHDLVVDPAILKGKLMPHQRVCLAFMLKRKIGLNGGEMGTGKTFPSIVCAKHLYDTQQARDCLVVCISTAKYNWAKEIDKQVNGATYTIIEGPPKTRAELYAASTNFKIVNYELLRNDIDDMLFERVFDCIIVDEIHRIRGYKSKQTKALYALGEKAKYRFGLTGTPLQNHLTDLHSVMRFIHPTLLGDWFHFDQRYCVKGYFGGTESYRRLDEVHNKLKTIMFRRMLKDVKKDLPDKVYNDIYIEMGTKQRKFYRDVCSQILESANEDVEEKVRQGNILANLTYLRESCDSTELIDPEVQESAKLDELKKILPELIENGHKVVVFTQWEKMAKIIERELTEIGIQSIHLHGGIRTTGGVREAMIEEFAASRTKNVFIMTTAGAESINLQMADYMVLFDLPFNPSVIAQIEGRLHRIGQESTVNIIKLIIQNSIEDRVLEILKAKTNLFREVIDGVSPEKILSQKEILNAVFANEK